MGFVAESSKVIETFSSIFLCLSFSSVFEGERSLSTHITVFSLFEVTIPIFSFMKTLSNLSPVK